MARNPMFTKSIPLSGGIGQGAPEELVRPPSNAWSKNARFSKTDSAEKKLPWGNYPPNEATGGSHFAPSHPMVLWSDDEQIATLGRNEVCRYQGDGDSGTWTQTDFSGDSLGVERRLATGAAQGGTDHTWAPRYSINTLTSPYTRTLTGYVSAYMRISYGDGSTSSDAVFEIFDELGNLEATETVADVCGVQVQPCAGSNVRATYCDDTGAVYGYNITSSATGFPTATKMIAPSGGIQTGTVNVNYDPRLSFATPNWVYDATFTTGRIKYEGLRPGFNKDAWENTLSHYKFKANHGKVQIDGGTGGAYAWLEGQTSQAIYVAPASSTGLVNGTKRTVTSGHTGMADRIQLLAVDSNTAFIYVLWAQTDTTIVGGSCIVYGSEISQTTGGVVTHTLRNTFTGSAVSGSLKVFQAGGERVAATYDGNVAYAITSVDGDMDDGFTANDHVRTDYGVVTVFGSTRRDTGVVYYARVASDIIIAKDDALHVALQQWGRWTPQRGSSDPDLPTVLPTKTKGVTTCVTRFDVGAGIGGGVLVATIDAGQSKVVPFPRDEMDTHVNNMYYSYNYYEPTTHAATVPTSHDIWIGNRVALGADSNIRILKAPEATSVTKWDGNKALNVGEAMLNVYRVSASYVDYDVVHFDDGFLINTAVPMWYDGANMIEAMVPDQPEIMTIADVSPGVSEFYAYDDLVNPDPNALFIQCICGFYDQNGTVHRSAPSFPVYIGGLKGDFGSNLASVTVVAAGPPSVLTRNPYFMEFYVGDAGEDAQLAATSFYTPGNVAVTTINALAHLTGTSDAQPIPRSTKFVYTTGSVLPADPWPSFKFSYKTARRMFAVSEQAPGTVYYSKLFEENVSPEFSAALTLSIGTNINITAMGGVDDKVFLFTKDATYVMYGTGPDNTGANGDFFTERVNIPLGCTDNQSVVTTPDGVMFFSSTDKRIHLITRDLQDVIIGEPIEDITAEPTLDVLTSLHVPELQEVRFYVDINTATQPSEFDTPNADAGTPARPPRPRKWNTLTDAMSLVYNYAQKKWTIHDTNIDVYAATVHKGKVAMIGTGWTVHVEDAGLTSTNYDAMEWTTAWLGINQLEDFGRFKQAVFMGRYNSDWKKDSNSKVRAGDLQIEVLYDYEEDDSSPETHLFRANQELNDTNEGNRFQFTIKPNRQKCQALKFRITEVPTTAVEVFEPDYAYGQGVDLLAVDLYYTPKLGQGNKTLGAGRKK